MAAQRVEQLSSTVHAQRFPPIQTASGFFTMAETGLCVNPRLTKPRPRPFKLAVIFVDDSDVIFESGQEHGLYRYLLTMLDGLESKSAGRVCVILTVMDVGNLPPALIRSGRIELWLEMRYPDLAARIEILTKKLNDSPPPLNAVDIEKIATATDGFSGADMKRVVEDGKTLYAYEKVSNMT